MISFPIKSNTFTFFNWLNGVKSLILLSRKVKNCSFSSWEIGAIFSIGFIYKPNVFNFFKLDSGDISFTLDSCSPNVSRFTICCKPSKLSIPIPKYTFNSLICAASSSVIGAFISVRCKTFLLIYCCNLLSDIIFFTCCCSSFFSFDSSILLFSEWTVFTSNCTWYFSSYPIDGIKICICILYLFPSSPISNWITFVPFFLLSSESTFTSCTVPGFRLFSTLRYWKKSLSFSVAVTIFLPFSIVTFGSFIYVVARDSSFVFSLYAFKTTSYVPSFKICPALFTSLTTAASAGVEYVANGNDNVAAINIAFICFLLLFFTLNFPPSYINCNFLTYDFLVIVSKTDTTPIKLTTH